MSNVFGKREEFIKKGDRAMSANRYKDALSAFLSAGVESVHLNWKRNILNKAMSILEIDFDNDGEKEVLVGTDGGQLFAFSPNGAEKEVFKETRSNYKKNYYIFDNSINSIKVLKESSGKDVIVVGTDKIYFLQYSNGLMIQLKYEEIHKCPISKLEIFTYKGEQRLVVGYNDGNVYSYKMDGLNITPIEHFHFVSEKRMIDIAIGDINGDEELEIVLVSEDKYVYFLNVDGHQVAEPFAAKHWITNIDIDKSTDRLYIGEFDGMIHLYKYQKERIKKIAALKQHGILDLKVMRLFGESSEPQFIIGTSDETMSIFDSIDYNGELLWAFITSAGQRTIKAVLINIGTILIYVGTESCELLKYTVCVDRSLKNKIGDAAAAVTTNSERWLDFPFAREQQNVLFHCIKKNPIVKTANYEVLDASRIEKRRIETFQKAALEMWWNGVEYKWSYKAIGRVYAIDLMFISNKCTVLVASQNNGLLGLDFESGRREWSYTCNGAVRGVYAGRFFKDIDRNYIVFATTSNSADSSFDKMYDNAIEVIDQDRNPVWGFRNKDWTLFVVADDINNDGDSEIFVGTEDKHIMAFRCDGVLMWQKNAEDRIRAVDVANLNGDGLKKLIVGSDDRKVYIYESDGSLITNFTTPHYVLIIKAFDIDGDGNCEIITGNEDGFIHVYDHSGNLIWQFQTGSWIAALDVCINPQTQEIEIIIGSADKSIYGINQNGVLLWQYEADARVRTLTTIINKGNNVVDIIFGSYSDIDNVYKLSRIDRNNLFNQMQKKYISYLARVPDIEKLIINGNYNDHPRHTHAFFYLFSENEDMLRHGAVDPSDLVLSAVGCAALRYYFKNEKLLDLVEDLLLSQNRKIRTTILSELERLISSKDITQLEGYCFLVRFLTKKKEKHEMTELVQTDIARHGYVHASNAKQLIMLADTMFPLTKKLIIDELHYVLYLLKHEKRFSSEIHILPKKEKEIIQKWEQYFTPFIEYKDDIKIMEVIINA